MAEKEVKIKVLAETDTGDLENLEDVLDDAKSKGQDLGETLSQAFEEATDKVESLKEELEFAEEFGFVGDIEDLEEQLAEAEEEAARLGDALDSINSGNLGDIASEFDNIGDSADNADNEIQELQSSMDLLEAGALMGISGELSSLGANAEGMAQQMNTAAISVGQLATNVGMAEPQMVSLINNISNATFPQEEAMAYVNALNQMGVSADKLGSAATNMDRINDATGIGYQSVMQLTQGLRAVGVEADNLPSSFNAIAYAQANVNGGADTLSMVLKRQAATINEYGLNVDQLVIIMQKLSEQGVQGMKMGSELSKVLKETNGDTRALEQSLGLQAGALSNATQATGQYEGKLQSLADEEAQHKTIVDQLGAAWEDMSLALSPVLSPLASVMGIIGQAGSWAVGVNGLIQLAQTTKVATAAQWLYNAALAANPITLVVLAVLALIAVLTYLYFTNEDVRAAIDGVGQALLYVGQVIYDTILGAIQWLSEQFQAFTEQLGLNTNDWIQAVLAFILFIPQLPARVAFELAAAIAHALGFKDNIISAMWNAAKGAYDKFKEGIKGLRDLLFEELEAMKNAAWDFADNLPGIIGIAAKLSKEAWQNNTNEKSPGDMWKMFTGELNAMEDSARDFKVANIMGGVAKDMVGNFNPNLGIGAAAGGSIGGGDTIINVYGDVDSDKRVKQIVDTIKEELAWNNTLAGRTV